MAPCHCLVGSCLDQVSWGGGLDLRQVVHAGPGLGMFGSLGTSRVCVVQGKGECLHLSAAQNSI